MPKCPSRGTPTRDAPAWALRQERAQRGVIKATSAAGCLSCTGGSCTFEELLLPTYVWQARRTHSSRRVAYA